MSKEIKIFIVEDDFVFIHILCDIVDRISKAYEPNGIKVTYNTFYSSKEAEFQLSKKIPDIVLLDYFIMNDEMEPDTATSFLKNLKLYDDNIDAIIVSGQEDKELIYKLKRQGASEYVGKDPESLAKLEEIIKSVIDKKVSI